MRSRRGWRRSWAAFLADPAALRSLTAEGHVPRLALGRLAIAPGSKPRQIGTAAAQGIGQRGKR